MDLIHIDFFNSKTEAMNREKYLKTGIGREFIKNIIQNLQLVDSYPPRRTQVRVSTTAEYEKASEKSEASFIYRVLDLDYGCEVE